MIKKYNVYFCEQFTWIENNYIFSSQPKILFLKLNANFLKRVLIFSLLYFINYLSIHVTYFISDSFFLYLQIIKTIQNTCIEVEFL